MVKTITINGKNYDMKASAYTQFAYRDLTGRSFLEDLQKLTKITAEDFVQIDGLIEIVLDISYVMIKENDPSKFKSEEDFIKSIDTLFNDVDWIGEVIGLAAMPLSGNLQKNQ